ncbi:MAG: cation:proton antiporter [Thermoplasmata archaeon]|nr:cation:proton antiporter [Thermoplasmata archaeon]
MIILVIVALLAFIAPLVCERIGIPIVVGEIIFGLTVGIGVTLYSWFMGDGPVVFGESLHFLSLIGLIFLMFLAGLEIDLNIIFSQGPRTLLKAAMLFEITLILSYLAICLLAGFFVELAGIDVFFLALVLSTTSVGVVVPTLRERRSSKTDEGQSILLAAIFADFATMTLLMLYTIGFSFESDTANVTILPVLFLAFLLALFLAIYLVGRAAIWRFPNMLARFFRMDDPTEIGVRSSIAILFIFVAISGMLADEASKSIAILGAFLAGVVLTLIFQKRELLEKQLSGLGFGFFIPFFFIYLGLTFDFGSILETQSLLMLIPVLLIVAYMVKILPSMIYIPQYGSRKALRIGILLSARLSLIIAAAEVGSEMGLINQALKSTIILVGVLTSIISPILFRKSFPGVDGQ